ncbi:hypothetical protein [Microbacterium sp. HJ5]
MSASRIAALEEHIARVVAEAPPLTEAQRSKLSALLNGAPAARIVRRSAEAADRIAAGGVE